MTRLNHWKSGAAALMALTVTTGTVAPMIIFAPTANAQLLNQNRRVSIPAGVTFPVTHDKDQVVVGPGETTSLTVRIANNIIDNNRNVLIPAGTEVVGRLEPVYFNGNFSRDRNDQSNVRGVRFVAQELIYSSGNRQSINASSQTITRLEKISRNNSSRILTDAAIGAGAATAISLITGNRRIEILEPVGGAAAGALASVLLRRQEAEVFVIRPQQDLRLALNSNLVVDTFR
ncbi:conjugal transfer protein TrbI [Anabaena subtropica]|uniref:Conjugal transfer protein TrbI n=1 Tax=Anabaena subtropica FACHB-260 TaxID=2692884 RepID=A0ABR8CPG1_9NOST|nr:conjugal transfer protein TrbI [Anabaena subtropica]MBD2345070.1 conjugal transfer protein TrbI [Anabaena subtropica FACHB-260]